MDLIIGFWLGAPYIWKGNTDWKKCSREYILYNETIVYDKDGNEITVKDTLNSEEDFYVLNPKTEFNDDCDIVKNFFKSYKGNKCFEKLDIRFQAAPLNKLITPMDMKSCTNDRYNLYDIFNIPDALEDVYNITIKLSKNKKYTIEKMKEEL
jgi:hypothetical protein